jgi:hypothetical protein
MKSRLNRWRNRGLLGLLFAGALVALAAEPGDHALRPTHRTELFDGKSLTGWRACAKGTNTTAIWSVTNGVIRCLGKPSGYLRTVATYRDYRLHVDWRWPDGAGNSGVFVHVSGADQVWPLCFEAQLQGGNAGELRFNGGALSQNMPAPDTKSLPRREPASEKPVGDWNTCEIICRSNTIAIRINGVLQNEALGTAVDSGAMALQAEGKLVEFRNIVIEPLPDR